MRQASTSDLGPRVTLNFDLLTSKVNRFTPSSRGPLVLSDVKIGLFVYKISSSQVW